MNIRDDKYQEAPEAFDAVAEEILSGLSQEKMTELNAQVSVEGLAPDDVAAAYLEEIGFVS